MLDIYIPSYQRPDAPVIRKLHQAGIPFTIVLDHADDVPAYAKWKNASTGIYLLNRALGIGYVRQKIKERWNGTPVVMIDDDTVFCLRRDDNPTRLITCKTVNDVRKWFITMDRFCAAHKFDIGSASDSVFKWRVLDKVIRSGSYCSVTIFNSERCRELTYDPQLYHRMEDHDLVGQAITKKFDFLICNEILRHCPMNKAAESRGGCSEVYQNDTIMDSTTRYLIKKWGEDIVTLSRTKKIGNFPDFMFNQKALRAKYGYDY